MWRDWALEGGVLLAVALLLPFVGEIGAKATLGVPGGGGADYWRFSAGGFSGSE